MKKKQKPLDISKVILNAKVSDDVMKLSHNFLIRLHLKVEAGHANDVKGHIEELRALIDGMSLNEELFIEGYKCEECGLTSPSGKVIYAHLKRVHRYPAEDAGLSTLQFPIRKKRK